MLKRYSLKKRRSLKKRSSSSIQRSKKRSQTTKAFYVLGLCTCDTKEQRDDIEIIIEAMKRKGLLPSTKYYIHLVNVGDRRRVSQLKMRIQEETNPELQQNLRRILADAPNNKCSTNEHIFSKKFLTSFGSTQPLPEMLKYKYTVIFNHFCPMQEIGPFSKEGMKLMNLIRTKVAYLVNPKYNIKFNKRHNLQSRLLNQLKLIGHYGIDDDNNRSFSIYQYK